MRNQRGFTLTELLVVGAIVVIMAAVAIPMYSGMIDGQRQEVVDNLAAAAAVSANAYFRRTGNDPSVANLGLFFPDSTRYSVSVDGAANTVTILDNEDSTIYKTLPYQ